MDIEAKILNVLAERGLILPQLQNRDSDAGFSKIMSDGSPRLLENATQWDDLRIAVNSIGLGPSTNPPQQAAYKGGYILAFEDEAVNEDIVYFVAQMPHRWKEGTNIIPHLHWVGEDNTAGNVKWAFTYSWANLGDAFPAESELTVVDANGETDVHNIASIGEISGKDKTLSSMLICSLRRNSTDSEDTLTNKDAYLLEFDIHYQIDSFGSREEYIK